MAEQILPNYFATMVGGYEKGRQHRDENRFRELTAGVMQGDPAARQEAYAISPTQAATVENAGDANLRRMQGFVDYVDKARGTGNPQAVSAALRAVSPYVSRELLGGKPLPTEWTPDMDAGWETLKARIAGATATGANGVQSTYINRAGQRVAIMRDGSQQVLGEADARTQLRDHPGMAPEIVDLRAGTTQQLRTGGAPQAGGEVPFSIDPTLPPEVQAAIRQSEATGQPLPEQITVQAPLAAARPAMSAGEAERIQIARENAAAARAAREDAAAARQAAEQAKADQKSQASAVRQAEAATAANQLIGAIDTLTQAPGFAELGTAMGDVKLNTPLIRSDVKDAEAQLKNVAGQVALATMARLKALSATGATGFGSLTAPELNLLQNSIATLQRENVSNEQLKSSLKTIRDTMEKVSAPQAAPQRRATDQPRQIQSAADYDALPSGAQYVAPDGSVRRKK